MAILAENTRKADKHAELTFDQQLEDYFQEFPYQVTYEYVLQYMGWRECGTNE